MAIYHFDSPKANDATALRERAAASPGAPSGSAAGGSLRIHALQPSHRVAQKDPGSFRAGGRNKWPSTASILLRSTGATAPRERARRPRQARPAAPPPVFFYGFTRSSPATVWQKEIRAHSVPVVEISGRFRLRIRVSVRGRSVPQGARGDRARRARRLRRRCCSTVPHAPARPPCGTKGSGHNPCRWSKLVAVYRFGSA